MSHSLSKGCSALELKPDRQRVVSDKNEVGYHDLTMLFFGIASDNLPLLLFLAAWRGLTVGRTRLLGALLLLRLIALILLLKTVTLLCHSSQLALKVQRFGVCRLCLPLKFCRLVSQKVELHFVVLPVDGSHATSRNKRSVALSSSSFKCGTPLLKEGGGGSLTLKTRFLMGDQLGQSVGSL